MEKTKVEVEIINGDPNIPYADKIPCDSYFYGELGTYSGLFYKRKSGVIQLITSPPCPTWSPPLGPVTVSNYFVPKNIHITCVR